MFPDFGRIYFGEILVRSDSPARDDDAYWSWDRWQADLLRPVIEDNGSWAR